MKSIVFFDTETDLNGKILLDIGACKSNGSIFHKSSISDFILFLNDSEYACGHNILNHDIKFVGNALISAGINLENLIDTLFLSPLLFPSKPYHALVKDDKLQTDELNNPLNDSNKAKDLFFEEITAFNELETNLKQIFYQLLNNQKEFRAFFKYLSYSFYGNKNLVFQIKEYFYQKICCNIELESIINNYPIELAYCLALINVSDRYSITPAWVIKKYPSFEHVMFIIRNKPCSQGCSYCDEALNAKKGLKKYFRYDNYRSFNGESLQENAVNAAINNKSLLAIFPTGGGKSITFQIPALMAGENTKGLTVVISPLQSLMKDQVDNLEQKGITEAVTINGLLDPIERSKSFERVVDGSASILYISPESLRSKSIEHMLLGRRIERFVIDEAHCFSSWGQDFRVDYLYIGDFIKLLQEKKNLTISIPVSCFTATAKQKVISDICEYFKTKLSLNLEVFSANMSRTNLKYKVYDNNDEEIKYNSIRSLIESKNCPTILYVSRTRKASELAQQLCNDGFNAKPYHGKMDIKEKTENQNAFIAGDVQIMVATSAFGMGVDKKDVGMVIHYEISDSLENYVQESGRAGRDENIEADCYVLYNEKDLDKHFILLNQTKLSIREIQQVWRAIKEVTNTLLTVSNSALEIARKAGWDENVIDIETRVKTAIAALEHAGYIKRGQNVPRIYANSILTKNAQEAIEKINNSSLFDKEQKNQAIRIIKKLFSTKSRKHSNDEIAESRIDYISDHLGIVKENVIKIINLLREAKILADSKDLTAFITRGTNTNKSLSIVDIFAQIENFLLFNLPNKDEKEKIYNIKELNEKGLENECKSINPNIIKTIINFWAIKNWIKRKNQPFSNNHISIICGIAKEEFEKKQHKRHELSKFIVSYLYKKSLTSREDENLNQNEILVEFSVHELKDHYKNDTTLFKLDVSIEDIEDTLFYLSRIGALKIEGGFLVIYNRLTIDRLEKNNKIQYKNEDYKHLDRFYQSKIEQIHIVGEYAKKMLKDYKNALTFVDDYFQLDYSIFLKKYFPGNKRDILTKNITSNKFEELFGALSTRQLNIINDNKSKNIVVAAGPGSGKTKVLAHKLASLIIMEDVKYEQLLMLTFSRASATEFKKRLLNLVGNAANNVIIKTFHSFCFDLLGRVGNLEKSDNIILNTIEKIKNDEVEQSKIVKIVLVIDEAQDMSSNEFNLVKTLINVNEEMRVIAVGDDDQNIYTFRGADSKHFKEFLNEKHSQKYELVDNYRSKNNLVEFANQYVKKIRNRFKISPIIAKDNENGKIRIVHYKTKNLIVPLVNDIMKANLKGTTAVLTITNDDAVIVSGLLLRNNMPAKLIQENNQFNLFNLYELRTFFDDINAVDATPTITRNDWNKAKINFANKHELSSNYELCKTLILDFQEINPKIMYKSDFENFIKESKIEDFINENSETIFVSTIHKAKGKEFDNVFLILDEFNDSSDDNKRQLYVAMTRAKKNLNIHTNYNQFENIIAAELLHIEDANAYQKPEYIVQHLTHNDVQLGYFNFIQPRINYLSSGRSLTVSDEGLMNSKGDLILKFSKKYLNDKKLLEKQGYRLVDSKVNYILYWNYEFENGNEREIKILLPELHYSNEKLSN
ncbi:MAG: RecQ family ATP-dependent DNA helicase [Candidatus Delongbacteria bacterium]|jgi:ATP-dependent DNA helicase RecQ|nr:RecQ family ATP-dependent DNA helicase [Candidatus Delongbacteria bacterium]